MELSATTEPSQGLGWVCRNHLSWESHPPPLLITPPALAGVKPPVPFSWNNSFLTLQLHHPHCKILEYQSHAPDLGWLPNPFGTHHFPCTGRCRARPGGKASSFRGMGASKISRTRAGQVLYLCSACFDPEIITRGCCVR